ncbi:MAG TPA: hypothetical protein VM432_12715 [Bdellovibrionales bacterium]|jgi:hypothetical protein|nr:hypothetical protein [Bdellovibrionales bacterium]
MKSLALIVLFSAFGSIANANLGFCAKYAESPRFMKAIETVATRSQYTMAELCQLGRLSDIFVESFMYTDRQTGERIPHSWVTLHYAEYSCQYLVRDSDQSYTKANCYGTW